MLSFWIACSATFAEEGEKAAPAPKPEIPAAASDANRRVELNLLGATDAAAGESRRNENVQFNLVDNNALKELNVRLGTTATIIQEFAPARGYFGAEFGNGASSAVEVPARLRRGIHGSAHAAHLNSRTSARSFFQVGSVKPARENDDGLRIGAPLGPRTDIYTEGRVQKLRGSVNGNVLVPSADERTPLATDPAVRTLVARYLDAYPAMPPNRTDVNPRALNTNAPQVIDNSDARVRIDQTAGARDRFAGEVAFVSQSVDAFQLVAGQNPDTETRALRGRIAWTRQSGASAVNDLIVGFDRLRSDLVPEPNSVGTMVQTSGLETLGPAGTIPIHRAQNLFHYASQTRRAAGKHAWHAGVAADRRQLNGTETDSHRGFFSFTPDFGRDAIANLRLGLPSQYIIAVGNTHRGFRSWELQVFAGDRWQATPRFTLSYGLRWAPATHPVEVNRINTIAYGSDWNNVAPMAGLAYRLRGASGVLRAAAGVHYGQIFPVTFAQVRFTPPASTKFVVTAPSLLDPLGLTQDGTLPAIRPNLYLLDPELATPYAYQYNASWEPDWHSSWRLQLGYVGSRSHKLFSMWYLNRAHAVPGIPQTTATINIRRPDPGYAEKRWVVNASRGYFDAARVSLVVPRWRGLSLDASYWFSKALDLGSSYTNTASDNDSRLGRSQSEFETHRDMRALSSFDQPHSFLWRWGYDLPAGRRFGRLGALGGGWNVAAFVLLKSGTPFNLQSGSDAPGYGNVDGNGADRPNLVDRSILGRSVGDPDRSRTLLPRSAFSYMAPTDESGNLGRNVFRKGAIRNVNAAVQRAWQLDRRVRLSVRAESVNLFNTPQFAEPGAELANANFGQITNTLNEGRTFRFQLQLAW